jgi:hypothetical protein
MRLLTGSDVLVEDRLFATLGTTVRTIVPPLVPPALVMDTVVLVLNKIDRVTDEQRAALAAELPDARVPRAGRQPAMNGRRGRSRQRAPAVHVRDRRSREPALLLPFNNDTVPNNVIMNFPAGPFATIRMDRRRRHHDAHLQRRDGRHRPDAPAGDAARLTCWE